MRRVILFPLLLVVSPIVWVVHHMLGGNKSAERRAVQYVQKHIAWYTDHWHARAESDREVRRLQAIIEAIDSVLQRPIRTPLGIMTAADYKRLILLRLERNYYARLIDLKPPAPALAAAPPLALGEWFNNKQAECDKRTERDKFLRAAQDLQTPKSPTPLYEVYRWPKAGNVTHQIQQPNPFQ